MNAECKRSVMLGSSIKVMLQHQSDDIFLLHLPAMILTMFFFLPSEIEAVNIDSSSVLWPQCCCDHLARMHIYGVYCCKQLLFDPRIKSWSAAAAFGGFNTTSVGLLTLELGTPPVHVTSWGGDTGEDPDHLHSFTLSVARLAAVNDTANTLSRCLSVITMLNS